MAKPAARQVICAVQLRITLLVAGNGYRSVADQMANASSPVFRAWEFSTMLSLVPLQRLTASAPVLRKRELLMRRFVDSELPPTQ